MEAKDKTPVPSQSYSNVPVEKFSTVSVSPLQPSASSQPGGSVPSAAPTGLLSLLKKWNKRMESLSGFEARGIVRVAPEDRDAHSQIADLQMFLLFFGANVSINNLTVGLFGPLVFELGFLDSSLCAVGGAAAGALSTAYMSTWGAASGCRTMIVGRFFMGYYPSKLCALLNIILMVGYCTVSYIIGGQVLSAVSGGTMTIAVGIVVVALAVLVITVIGLKIFHIYERYAWIPQVLVLFVLIGSAGPKFATSLASTGSATHVAANRLSFFSLCFYVPNSWAAAASDFYVYYPENTPKWKTFILNYAGLTLSFAFVNMLGVGLASGVATNTDWESAYSISSGALITIGFAPLASFGKFCAVITALGLIANSVPGTYSAALGCQMMGSYFQIVPRWVCTAFLCIVELVCALAGRDKLFIIFQNFLALMGYWLMIMICIIAEEHVLFRWRRGVGFDWTAWQDKSRLPVGAAALVSFLLGWMGAILGMYQVWYVGPIAKLAGDVGADVGMWVGCGFAFLAFPPLRVLELKYFRR